MVKTTKLKMPFCILILLVLVFTLCGCSLVEDIVNNINVYKIGQETGEKLMNALKTKDKNSFVSLFSKQAQTKDKEYADNVDTFFQYINDIHYKSTDENTKTEEPWNIFEGGTVSDNDATWVNGNSDIIINKKQYKILFSYVYRFKTKSFKNDPEWIGIYNCVVLDNNIAVYNYNDVDSDFDEASNAYRDNLNQNPGFYFYPANEVSQ